MEARSAGTVKLGSAGPPRSAPALSVNPRRAPRVQTLGWWSLLLAAVLLALAVGTAVHESFPGRRSVGAAHVRAHRFSHAGLLSLPVAAQGPVSAALGADGQAYRVSRLRGGFAASSPAQRLSTSFTRSGVSVRSGTTRSGSVCSPSDMALRSLRWRRSRRALMQTGSSTGTPAWTSGMRTARSASSKGSLSLVRQVGTRMGL